MLKLGQRVGAKKQLFWEDDNGKMIPAIDKGAKGTVTEDASSPGEEGWYAVLLDGEDMPEVIHESNLEPIPLRRLK